MEVLPLNQVKSRDNKQQSQNTGNITVICFAPNNDFDDNTDNFNIQLHQISDNVIFHTEFKSCITFIQSIEQDKIFLILSSSSVSHFLFHMTTLRQIDSVFIFCSRKDQYEHLPIQHTNIIGTYDNLDLLCISIRKQTDLIEKGIHPSWCFFDQLEYMTKDLSKQSNDFLWLQLFHAVLLHLPRQPSKRVDARCHYYPRIVKELTWIDQFEHEYQPNEAIRWFMKHSLLRRTINKALQNEDTNQLYTLRYFLSDLLQNLRHEHQQQIDESNRQESLTVYREMALSNDQFKKLQENKGKLISMKGFLIATTERSSASIECADLISVLFQIECNLQELDDNFIFADITHFNELSSQQTVLFDLNTTFRLETIQQNGQMWLITLNAVNDGQIVTQKYIDDTHHQIEDLSIPIIFGKLICDMSQWNQSQMYFQHLLDDQHDEDLAWIEHSIGQAHHWKGEWNEAREYYDRSYEQMMHSGQVRFKYSAVVLSDIGEILYLQGKYEEALGFHQRALIIRKKNYSSHHPYIASSLENIGLIFQKRLQVDEACILFQRALVIREKYYKYFHVDKARSLRNIAYNLIQKKKYDEALVYYERAMSIYKQCYSSGHVHIADTPNCIGDIFRQQAKFDKALDILQQALTMQNKLYPSGHIDVATGLIAIGNIKYDQGNHDKSLELYHQALTMYKKYYSSGHIAIAVLLNHIGDTQLRAKGNCNKALHFHQQALTMLETCYPSYLGHIVMTLNYIGNILTKQEKNDEALEIYHRALKMQEDYYLSDHVDIVSILRNTHNTLEDKEMDDEVVEQQTLIVHKRNGSAYGNIQMISCLNGICNILDKQNKYDEALVFYQRAVDILKEYDPTDHRQIVHGLERIGFIWSQKQSYDRAIECYEQCLNVREASLSPTHLSIADALLKLGQIQRIRHQYEHSLPYELKCFLIREQVLPPNHQDIGKSLANIGECYEHLNQRKLALDHYKRTLAVYKQCLSSGHEDRSIIELKIEQLG